MSVQNGLFLVVINNNLVVLKITSVVTVERFGKTSNDCMKFLLPIITRATFASE